jgi:hypothetical protein
VKDSLPPPLPTNTSLYHKRFSVTPDRPAGWASPRYWGVDKDGKLEHYVARRIDSGVPEYYTRLYTGVPTDPGVFDDSLGSDTIYLIANVDVDGIVVTSGQHITFTVDPGAQYTIKRVAGGSNNIIRIEHTASLEMSASSGGALIIDGGAVWGTGDPATGALNAGMTASGSLIYVSGDTISPGVFILGYNAILQNNDRGGGDGGAVEAGGDFIMKPGALITHNKTAGNGGGIAFAAPLGTSQNRIIEGGTIRANDAGGLGGGVMLDLSSKVTLVMRGGTITANRAKSPGSDLSRVSDEIETYGRYGGGIFVPNTLTSRNQFIMEGGSITGNFSNVLPNDATVDKTVTAAPLFRMSGSARIGNIVLHSDPGSYGDCSITVGAFTGSGLVATIDADNFFPRGYVQALIGLSPWFNRFAAAGGHTLNYSTGLLSP